MATRVVLVRHAQAVCNVEETWAGHETCRGLTAAGHAQRPAIAARVRAVCGEGGDVVLLSSLMRRAVETAEGVAAGLGLPTDFVRRCGLCERHPGSCDGTPVSELADALAGRAELPATVERSEAFMIRARRELRHVAAAYRGRTVVAVTHGGLIAASFWAFGGVTARLPFRLRAANGSLTEWSTDDVERGPWMLERYNDLPRSGTS